MGASADAETGSREPSPGCTGLGPDPARWLTTETAPRDGSPILLLLGETIPDTPDWRVGSFIGPDECLDLGYREYSRFGGWLIWNTADDWFAIDETEPEAWAPLPLKAASASGSAEGESPTREAGDAQTAPSAEQGDAS